MKRRKQSGEREMERENQNGAYVGRGVMTEEQMETLRKQIAVYAVICEQLALLHNSLSSFQPLSSGSRVGINPNGDGYFNPMVASSSAQRISTRNRWTPTSTQLQILESIYEEKSGTPNRRRIREIATELSEHGQITETNVYNWFQNRRARSKRKQPQTMATTDQAEDAAVTTDEKRSCGDSGGFESYEHILFPSPDLGIEHLLSRGELSGDFNSYTIADIKYKE
ncbi:WUSCHEL-related homeobox 14-like isoform X1 [Brassica napus]|uniref:WUSCHEL-related homeobox 14-like isoform X1 n=1 Tax=Brassica napus TaxID=3708 RepID=UPI000BBE3394|nr:WUSCHEL-related homeobox 14-like isoform X1 [Brassica napus]